MTESTSFLDVENLSVAFGGVTAVDDVSMTVAAGAMVGLIGANGAGKTTVLDAISGLVPVTAGHLRYEGVSLDDLPPHQRAALGLGRTFQAVDLFADLTVGENLLVAAEAAGRARRQSGTASDRVQRATALAGTSHLDAFYPSQLSHLDKVTVALARALAGNPTLVLLDEPAAGLDEREQEQLAAMLRRMTEAGVGVLLVDHNLDLVLDVCHDVWVLDAGAVIAHGPPAVVRDDPKVVAAYLGSTDAPASTEISPAPPAVVVHGPAGVTPATPASSSNVPVLEARDLTAGYDGVAIVRGVDLHVDEGEVVALLGANGAGKSTLLKALCGDVPALSGQVRFLGDLRGGTVHGLARRGLAYVPEQRGVLARLTVAENLALSGPRAGWAPLLARPPFSLLAPLLDRQAGLLSGGEQQLLVLARAAAGRPKVLVVDELSLGLSPVVARQLFEGVATLAAETGVAALVVEQRVALALSMADRAYVMEGGRITLAGEAAELARADHLLEAAYLGRRRRA